MELVTPEENGRAQNRGDLTGDGAAEGQKRERLQKKQIDGNCNGTTIRFDTDVMMIARLPEKGFWLFAKQPAFL